MKKKQWIGITVIVLVLAGVAFYFVNGIWGNPISKMLAEHAANDYIEEHYQNQDLSVERIVYNFKNSAYSAYVVSDTSIDTHFTIDVSASGKIKYDSFNEVESGWNTYCRIEEQYRNLVEQVFDAPEFPLESDIDYGELKMYEKSGQVTNTVKYGIDMAELEKDKLYDIKELGMSSGHIVYYVKDKEVSYRKAAEYMLLIKSELDQAGVPFYAMDFVLEEDNGSEKQSTQDAKRVNVEDFLYEDIYEDGLEARIETADTELNAYYDEMDALRGE